MQYKTYYIANIQQLLNVQHTKQKKRFAKIATTRSIGITRARTRTRNA